MVSVVQAPEIEHPVQFSWVFLFYFGKGVIFTKVYVGLSTHISSYMCTATESHDKIL